MKTNPPELLAPAGSPETLDAAVAEGADAVYLGLKSFNARMRSANFAYCQFEGALRSLHRMGRRLYVAVNTVFEQREADRIYQLLKYLAATGPDGIIIQDFGLLLMAREFPQLKIHASTQMNIASARGANALSKYGVSRVVLARELSLEEISAIGRLTNVEMEVFVHGALCASASGLCLFSSYLGGKSANRGLCTQACRRLYHTESARASHRNFTPELDDADPSQAGYYFSPCDLSLIDRVPELTKAGVRSFKIEGRMKSAEYVGTVVSAYRRVIDSAESGEEERRRSLADARSILQNDFARPKTEFFFSVKSRNQAAVTSTTASATVTIGTVFRPEQDGGTGISMGTILNISGSGSQRRALVKSGSQLTLSPGDSVRLHKADDSRRQAHKLTFARKSGGNAYLISIPEDFEAGDSVYLIQTKSMTRRYPQVLPKDLSSFKRQPGREKTPPLPDGEKSPFIPDRKNQAAKKQHLPEGIFTAVASTEDLYIVQSIKPAGVILPVNRKTIRSLLEEKPLPFKAQEIILAFDPWFPQEEECSLAELPEQLEERGYCRYILNNPGHFSLFKNNSNNKDRNLLIAGPWLYTFNSWAAAFTNSLNARYCITPLENNRQNLEKTFPLRRRGAVFVTLFAWPPLFRIKTGTSGLYGFTSFTGSRNESFTLINGDGNSIVIPDQPFSLTDKKTFLVEAGFRRFVLDFSAGMFNGSFPLKKKLYKEVMNAAVKGLPLSGISRFNWKNGFFSEKS